jgi:signal transduction histidine kinase
LLKSSPVRQAIGVVSLMAVISVTTTAIAFLRVREGLEEAIFTSLDLSAASFSTARTPDALRSMVVAEAQVADPEQRIIALLPADGGSVGNAIARLDGGLPAVSPLSKDTQLSDEGYEFRVIADDRGTLILGETREGVEEISEVFVALVALSLVPTLLLSLAAALVIAARSARRVVRIQGALERLTAGDLKARVAEDPVQEDDLARIAGGLDRMAAAQEASVAALKQVSADIAHDLKTPVQRIAVLMAELRNQTSEGSPEAALAERALAEADRAVAVFQALLQIAQIEGRTPKGRFRSVDLSAVVSTFADIYGPAVEDSGHSLVVDLPSGQPVQVQGDRDLLGQVVANLIENALRHTPEGSAIRLSLRQEDASVVLAVADNGPGIPEAERALVLRRLYRREASRTTEGNGLGLALVAAIADLHEARLQLSDNAPGLIVSLIFPILATPPA